LLQLSPSASKVAEIVQWLETLPQMRQGRVAQLSRLIASGEYRVPIEEIVEILLRGEAD